MAYTFPVKLSIQADETESYVVNGSSVRKLDLSPSEVLNTY